MRFLSFLPAAAAILFMATVSSEAADTVSTADLTSDGRTYRIWETTVGNAPPQGYPLVVLLDGNQTFPLAEKIAREAGTPRVLVAIGYPEEDRESISLRRYFDLTSETEDEFIPLSRSGKTLAIGGEQAFIDLIVDEILPAVEKRHPVDHSNMALFGHSLSGRTALNMLFAKKWPFTRYVAADPSIWWGNSAIMGELERYEKAPLDSAISVDISTSGKRVTRPDVTSEAAKRMQALRKGPGGKDVAGRLAKIKDHTVRHFPMPEETHGSMVEPSIRILLN